MISCQPKNKQIYIEVIMGSYKTPLDHPHINGVTPPEVAVVMVPLPAQGHLNQLLQLSRLIASYKVPVHYVGTAIHNRQVKIRAHAWDPLASTHIHFHEFPTPSFPTPTPNPSSTNKFPSQLLPALKASLNLREPVRGLLQQLSGEARRVIVIYDSLMAWVIQDVPSITNAEPYCFQSVSAFTVLSFHYEILAKPVPAEAAELMKDLPSWKNCFPPEFLEFSKMQRDSRKFNHGNLYNTCKAIEGPFLDLLAKENVSETNKQWALGPFNRVVIYQEKKQSDDCRRRHECLEWLDRRPPTSVLLVSFGTTTSLSDEQIKELAIGLDKSEQNFIWVLRDADRVDVFAGEHRKAQLPEGFEDRIAERGFVVRDWAPQVEILGHPSIGGFMSHCGWNSCMESISMGVPIAAWPMHSDQPRNAVLITKALKIGLMVKDWARSEEIVASETIQNCVKRLMASPEGEEMRRKALELSNAVKKSVMEGGDTRKEMDSFIAHITG